MTATCALPQELSDLIADFRITSPQSFEIRERRVACGPGELEKTLAEYLYTCCYTDRYPASLSRQAPNATDMTEILEAGQAGEPFRDQGWLLKRPLPGGEVIATKSNITRRFRAGQYMLLDGLGAARKEGQRLLICTPAATAGLQPGYYHIFGETVLDETAELDVLRFYFNVAADGAPSLLRMLRERLDYFQVPFRAKVHSFREAYYRRDAAVLYVGKRFYRIAALIAGEVQEQVREFLEPDVPLFTRPLAKGLGFAEDPDDGNSFGFHRCGIVAAALCAMGIDGAPAGEAAADAIASEFRERGLSLNRPHLNGDYIDGYDFPVYQ